MAHVWKTLSDEIDFVLHGASSQSGLLACKAPEDRWTQLTFVTLSINQILCTGTLR